MFVCEKNYTCCNFQYADKFENLDEDAKSCGYIIEVMPIVRCKDCKHYHTGYCYLQFESNGSFEMNEEDFCSRGENRV